MKHLAKFLLTVTVILLVFLSVFLAIFVGAAIFSAATDSSVHYSIETSGLFTASADEPVVLYFPLPLIHETQALSEEHYTQTFDGWETRFVETPHGMMLECTATEYPLKDIRAEFRERDINYLDMIFSNRVPGDFGSLSFSPSVSFSSNEVFAYENILYEPTDTASMIIFPETFSAYEPIEVHLHIQLATAPNLAGLFTDRWIVDHLYSHIRLENVSGCVSIPLFTIKEYLPFEGEILPTEPLKGVYDSFLSIEGIAVPGHTTHYDYLVGNTTNELRIALVWDDLLYPLTMTLISPRGYVLGPYTDGYDSRNDGKIPLVITSEYFLSGEWGIDVSIDRTAPPLDFQPYQIHVREY